MKIEVKYSPFHLAYLVVAGDRILKICYRQKEAEAEAEARRERILK